MSAVLARPLAELPTRFEYLMGLYAENYRRLSRLYAVQRLPEGNYRSEVGDRLAVALTVCARQPYTVDMSLSYAELADPNGTPSPSAQLRIYLDARMAEALHCEPGRQLWQVLGRPLPHARSVMQHRLRMATFLSRWLDYLAEQGHSLGTLKRIEPR